jgi:protein SCO1/2
MTSCSRQRFAASVFAALLLTLASSARAQTQTQTGSSPAEKYFTNVELVDQDNKTLRLYSDLLKNRVVVINSFYASEHQACTAMFQNLVKVRDALGAAARDVTFISITVDPLIDAPPKLKAFAQRFDAGAGWSFISGKKENVELALQKLGMSVANKDDHLMIVIIGNERNGLWKKALAMANPNDIAKIITDTANDK